ncbi:hypothetical protein [Hydrogenophaga sp.]|uniref:hypothetical protein n=1 Tax=Hydrogenophaga sp. TaxID=1904254 RepID=UPI002722C47E|nr:hypothetical protein [Hydrogenophaga sp.]MDO9438552.1 hypothetical protein [Hydrogenophaga sp.]
MSATLADARDVIDPKALATVKAGMALRGFQVHDTVTGGWLVARWNLSRYCPTFDDLREFAQQVDAA